MSTFSLVRTDRLTAQSGAPFPYVEIWECTLAYSDWSDGSAKSITALDIEGFKEVLVRIKSTLNQALTVALAPGVYFGATRTSASAITDPDPVSLSVLAGNSTTRVLERRAKPIAQDGSTDGLSAPDTLGVTITPAAQPTTSGSVTVQLLCRM